jgi:peroxiredoxin
MRLAASLVVCTTLLAAGTAALAAAVPGQPAPAFKGTDVNGKPVSLADFKGKYVVLEWNNPSCPFVMKHYDSGNMQALQKRYGADNVAWVAVNSTSDMHSEYMPPEKLAAWFRQQNAAPAAVLVDTKGEIARAYGAKVTPHMFVIDPKGTVVYAGAIDDKRSSNPADVKSATNYVSAALADARSGKPVATSASNAYGCSIKY